jgi:hypothetical protein
MRAYFVRGTCGEIHLAMWHAEERMSWVHCGPAGGSRNHPFCRLRWAYSESRRADLHRVVRCRASAWMGGALNAGTTC